MLDNNDLKLLQEDYKEILWDKAKISDKEIQIKGKIIYCTEESGILYIQEIKSLLFS